MEKSHMTAEELWTKETTLKKLSEMVYIVEPKNYKEASSGNTKVIKAKAPTTVKDLEELALSRPNALVMHRGLEPLFKVSEYAQAVELFSKAPNEEKTFEAFKSRGLRNVIVKLMDGWTQNNRLDEADELEALKRSNPEQLIEVLEASQLLYGPFLPQDNTEPESTEPGLIIIPSRLMYSSIRSFPGTILNSLLKDHCLLQHEGGLHVALTEVVRIIPAGSLPTSITSNFETYSIRTNDPKVALPLFLKVFLGLLNTKLDEIYHTDLNNYPIEYFKAVRESAASAARGCQALELES